MPAIVVGIITTIITIGSVVYTVGKTVYNWIVKPLQKVTDIINSVRDVIRGVVKTIQEKIDYVLDVTEADIFLDLVHGITEFGKLAEQIAQGNKEALIIVLGDLYEAIAGIGGDVIHFVSDALSGVTDSISQLQDDIEYITEFKIKQLTEQYLTLGEEIRQMNLELIEGLRRDIEEEIEFIKGGISERVRYVDGEINAVRFLTEDMIHFLKQLTKALEL